LAVFAAAAAGDRGVCFGAFFAETRFPPGAGRCGLRAGSGFDPALCPAAMNSAPERTLRVVGLDAPGSSLVNENAVAAPPAATSATDAATAAWRTPTTPRVLRRRLTGRGRNATSARSALANSTHVA
jgi:hypothetical protein